MKLKSLLFIIFISFFGATLVKADPKADSLLIQLRKAKEDTVRIRLYNELSDIYTKTKPDSAFYYVNYAIKLANKLIDSKNEDIIPIVKNLNSNSYTNLGNYYKALGESNNAIINFKKSLDIRNELKDQKGVANNYIDIGIIKTSTGNYLSAEEYLKKAIEVQEKIQDSPGLAKAFRNMGNVYHFQGDPQQAIEFYKKSLELSEKINDLESVSRCANNIGIVYSERKLFNCAFKILRLK